MRIKTFFAFLIGIGVVAVSAMAEDVRIRVDCTKPAAPLSPHLYGLFFEDINFAADGGLYAELVQNRSFEYYSAKGGPAYTPLTAWEKVERGGASCEIAVGSEKPLNANNTKHLQIKVDRPGSAAGVSNSGFDGIPVDAGARYNASFYARTVGWSGFSEITASIELPDGTVCGSAKFRGVGSDWRKFEGVITSGKTADDARFVITTAARGTLDLDMVSLFPQDTYRGRKNGLRKDLVQALQELNPKFLRFPGGCITHGHGLENAYSWKDTVGDVAWRKPNWNLWGYHQTYGLGFFEYFQLCEDLGMQPLPVLPVGISCGFRKPQEVVPMNKMRACADDALDLIEFANGPATSEWGAVRARMGHPEPFKMEFICLGNEENDNPDARERLRYMVEAIRKAHPEIKIIGTSGLGPGIPLYNLMKELNVYSSDEHYYEPPQWFIGNQHRFDDFDRKGPKVFVGEYGSRNNTLFNAIAEAAYLTGVERNGDMVDMTCYAPLFAHLNHNQWRPDLIFFDKRAVVRTPNYYVQQLFAQNKGDVYVGNTITSGDSKYGTIAGAVGIGTWNTAIEVGQMSVNGKPLDPGGWEAKGGNFRVVGASYVQTDRRASPAISVSGGAFEGETVTYAVRARKTGGREGFLVVFGSTNGDEYWWNVGGWDNTRHGLQRVEGDSITTLVQVPGSVQDRSWHDLKVELSPGRIRCYLDGKQIHNYEMRDFGISVSTTLDMAAREVILKLVSYRARPVRATVSLEGVPRVEPKGKLISLSGDRDAINTRENPYAIKPVTGEIRVDREFEHEIPPMSVQVIRVKAAAGS